MGQVPSRAQLGHAENSLQHFGAVGAHEGVCDVQKEDDRVCVCSLLFEVALQAHDGHLDPTFGADAQLEGRQERGEPGRGHARQDHQAGDFEDGLTTGKCAQLGRGVGMAV